MKTFSVSKNRHKTLREWASAHSRSGGNKIALFSILLLAAFFRFYGLNWDQGYHLHPDERMIVMVTEGLHLPKPLNLRTILDPNSPLNPKFFAYGNFPLYFLKAVSSIISQAFGREWTNYSHINLLGRGISVIFDLGTVLLIFKIGKKVFSRKTALLASSFYALCVLPIQLSHFYAVDIVLNFFILLTFYRLILFYEKQNFRQAILLGVSLGLALATKVSATILLVSIGTALIFDIFLVFLKRWRMATLSWWKKIFFFVFRSKKNTLMIRIIRVLVGYGLVISASTVLTFLVCQPHALIDFPTFWRQINEQHRMTKDAFTFPYTLQYVGTTPYLYHLKNLWLWGMGIGLGNLSIIGTVFYLVTMAVRAIEIPARCPDFVLNPRFGNQNRAILTDSELRRDKRQPRRPPPRWQAERSETMTPRRWRKKKNIEAKEIILIVFLLTYFLVVGRFAVKFMRYLLPLYPLFCLFAAWFVQSLVESKKATIALAGKISLAITLGFTLLWAIAFMSIYTKPNTRVLATRWFEQNVPHGSKIAVEHWDDRVPMWGNYQFLEMPMYEPDTSSLKWQQVEKNLQEADYLVLASNRLYVPLQKLNDCQKYKVCYPKTAKYYQDLFAGNLGFRKVAEFTSYPTIPILNWQIKDDAADESFTVYDHPKVIIFKKT